MKEMHKLYGKKLEIDFKLFLSSFYITYHIYVW